MNSLKVELSSLHFLFSLPFLIPWPKHYHFFSDVAQVFLKVLEKYSWTGKVEIESAVVLCGERSRLLPALLASSYWR